MPLIEVAFTCYTHSLRCHILLMGFHRVDTLKAGLQFTPRVTGTQVHILDECWPGQLTRDAMPSGQVMYYRDAVRGHCLLVRPVNQLIEMSKVIRSRAGWLERGEQYWSVDHSVQTDTIMCAQLANYTLVSAFGRERHLRGGVAIYKQSELPTEVLSLDIESLSSEMICEVSAVKIILDKKENLYVLGIYGPPLLLLIRQ
ncbi:hypothetical protein J6590_016165 [Homalodisca vitripennis]|nr:hypothetical protein J6590_016165 [Homalodisca vitripennis]